MKLLLACILVASLAACQPQENSSSPAPLNSETVTVTRVVDGDTLVISNQGQEERVRLIGVDTPESVNPNVSDQCFGQEASDYLKSLLPSGTLITLELDQDPTDRYDRKLAYVYRASDSLFINADLLSQGYALPLTITPNIKYKDRFAALAVQAEANNLGLHKAC